ncbi:hypothetical protein GCM10025772_27800 [Ferrimonas gelatinilytica]|uniref:DUF481 domain-containing protein n=2 Tax=Ferrimonas gelatinilytica TaxID=1255257 RepID=A0ABP9SDI2_9GAMM
MAVLISLPITSPIQAGSWEIELGTFFSQTDTNIRVYDPFAEKDRILNFESELMLPHDRSLPYFDVEYRFNDRHHLYFDWRRLHRDGTQEDVTDPFQFTINGYTYHVEAGSYLETVLEVDIMRFGYGFRFFQGEDLALDLLAGVHVTHLGLGFIGDLRLEIEPEPTGGGDSEIHGEVFSAVTAPLPNLGLRMEFTVGERIVFISHGHAFYLEVDEITGWMYELEVAARYRISEAWSVTGSLSYYELGVDYRTKLTTIDVTYEFYGPMLKVAYRF